MDINERIARKKAIKARQVALVKAYTKSRVEGDNTPREAVSILEDMIGPHEAILAVAELVNTVGSWDGRVSAAARAWATSIKDAAQPDELETLGVYQPGEIHPAHISNLASYCMRAGTGKGECQ